MTNQQPSEDSTTLTVKGSFGTIKLHERAWQMLVKWRWHAFVVGLIGYFGPVRDSGLIGKHEPLPVENRVLLQRLDILEKAVDRVNDRLDRVLESRPRGEVTTNDVDFGPA